MKGYLLLKVLQKQERSPQNQEYSKVFQAAVAQFILFA